MAWTDEAKLDRFLADSWEPFAVTDDVYGAIVWLRRSADCWKDRVVGAGTAAIELTWA
jgi:hypothetical protein